MSASHLKYLQPAQYDSWLRKVDDPDWYEHRYRDHKDNAMASAIRELRDALSQRNELLEALKIANSAIRGINDDGTSRPSPYISFTDDEREAIASAIAKAEGK